jgi:zinc/manganese transport system substrate-binding protein
VLHVDRVMAIGGDNPNPHLWYDTAELPLVADAIAKALGQLDPADAVGFTSNAATFVASLTPITDVITTIKSRYAGTAIAYTERVPGYLVSAAGLTVGVPASFTQAVGRVPGRPRAQRVRQDVSAQGAARSGRVERGQRRGVR